jgi:hypothetical protein
MIILSQELGRAFLSSETDIANVKVPNKYVGQVVKLSNGNEYIISEIDSNGNAVFIKNTNSIDLEVVNQRVAREENTRAAQIGNLANIDSAFNNANLVQAISSITKKVPVHPNAVDADYIANAGDIVLVDTSSAEIKVSLPAGVDGIQVVIKDIADNASNNSITVNTNGSDTIDGDSSLLIDVDNALVTLVFSGEWKTL